tara:strand:- start:192 stop:398 length:207 start_codon:yes stop_codon:yes gene_type:complete
MNSIEQQIKDLREALNDMHMKLLGFQMIEKGVAAEDMEAIKVGLEMAEGIRDCHRRALDILNGDGGEA